MASQKTPSGRRRLFLYSWCTRLKRSNRVQRATGCSSNNLITLLKLSLSTTADACRAARFHSDLWSYISPKTIDFLSESGKKSALMWKGRPVLSSVGSVANSRPLSLGDSGIASWIISSRFGSIYGAYCVLRLLASAVKAPCSKCQTLLVPSRSTLILFPSICLLILVTASPLLNTSIVSSCLRKRTTIWHSFAELLCENTKVLPDPREGRLASLGALTSLMPRQLEDCTFDRLLAAVASVPVNMLLNASPVLFFRAKNPVPACGEHLRAVGELVH